MKHPVKYDFSRICRTCLNQKYNLRLRSKDCYYLQYPAQCKDCGEVCNIVAGVTGLAKLYLLANEKKSEEKS